MNVLSTILGLFGFGHQASLSSAYARLKLRTIQLRVGLGRTSAGRLWFYTLEAKQFRSKHLEQRVSNESMIRLPVAR